VIRNPGRIGVAKVPDPLPIGARGKVKFLVRIVLLHGGMKALVLALALVIALATGCSSYALHHGNRIGIAAATLTLACDAGQTLYAARSGGYTETNPMLGKSPSETTIGIYFATTAVVTGVAWWALPEKWRPVLWGTVTAVELDAIRSNLSQDVPLCGLR
jgi:hypothetical protein